MACFVTLAARGEPARLLPPALPPGGTIAIVGPASRIDKETVRAAKQLLEQKGYKVKLGEALHGPGLVNLAGSDEARAADFNRAVNDPEVDAILCARGGYGAPRLLDRLDYDALRRRPKPVIGYSDITALHMAILAKSNVVALHGPMLKELVGGHHGSAYTREQFWHAVGSCKPLGKLKPPPGGPALSVWRAGEATGELMGGNLTLLAALAGTPYALQGRGRVLLIEDVIDEPYRTDRMLAQLRLAGAFDGVRAVLVGAFIARDNQAAPRQLEQVLKDYFLPLQVPILANVPCGHGKDSATFPLGVPVRVTTDPPAIEFLRPALRCDSAPMTPARQSAKE